MKVMENQTFDMERALYGSNSILVTNCSFDGSADGESVFKEGTDIVAEHCGFPYDDRPCIIKRAL